MAQINFTLDHDFFIGLFKENRDEAFGVNCKINFTVQFSNSEVNLSQIIEQFNSMFYPFCRCSETERMVL